MRRTIYLSGNNVDILEENFSSLKDVEITKGFLNGTKMFPTLNDVVTKQTTAITSIKLDYNDDVVELGKILQIYAKLVNLNEVNNEENLSIPTYQKVISFNDLIIGIEAKSYIEENIGTAQNIKFIKMLNFYKWKEK